MGIENEIDRLLSEKNKGIESKDVSLEGKLEEPPVLPKKELKKLELEQMTKPMTPPKEKEIIERIAQLHLQIKEYEKKLSEDVRLKRALEELQIAKERAEKQHAQVETLAEKAQKEHETMIKLLKQCDNLVKKVNEVQENIVFVKIEADNVHKQFIECVDKIHELERTISATRERSRREKKAKETSSIRKEADEIFERFKRGEKLSTEDILLLQKAGLI